MGPDDGVQRVLKTGLASAGDHGLSIAVWARSGKVFAEARVFPRGDSRKVDGIIETLKVEADESDLAVVLLGRKVEEKYGQLKRVYWWPFADAVKVGQRVWVLHSRDNSTERVEGAIASVGSGLLSDFGSFVVRLDDRNCIVTCALAEQGTRWDFATD